MNKKLLLQIEVIDHKDQAYPTVGNWLFQENGSILIQVSDTGSQNYAFLIGIHEAIESWLCRMHGISQKAVDRFDIRYEHARKRNISLPCGCKPTATSEPGDDPHAPYGEYHKFATKIEKQLSKALMVSWKDYEKHIEKL